MPSLEEKLSDCVFQLRLLLFPQEEIDPTFYQIFPAKVDRVNHSIEVAKHLFVFDLQTLEHIESCRHFFRSKVNNINNLLAWTTYFHIGFDQRVQHFDPFVKSVEGRHLQMLNKNTYEVAKQMCHMNTDEYGTFCLFDDHFQVPLLFLFDMEADCPYFAVFTVGHHFPRKQSILYYFFLRDRKQ